MSSDRRYNLWDAAATQANALTASGQEPRRHHLLPRFYIERWAVNDRVRVVDLLRDRKAHERAPLQAAIETDFYRLDRPHPRLSPVYWESWLSQVEDKGAAAIARIDADGIAGMDEETHEWLCLLLAVQMTRSRSARRQRRAMFVEQIVSILERYGREEVGRLLYESGREFDAADLEVLVNDIDRFRDDPTLAPLPREEDLAIAGSTATHIAGILVTRHLAVYRTKRAILTTDEPVVELHPDMAHPSSRAGVWGAPIFVFPLSPYLVIALYRRDLEPPLEAGSTLTALETIDLNSVILANGYSFAITRSGDRIAEKLFLPDAPVAVRSEAYVSANGLETLFRFWTPRRWENRPDAPQRPVGRWWPGHVPNAPDPTPEEISIMESWSND